MGLIDKGKNNKLSSTNIAEILEAQIEAIKKVNDVIIKGKVDQAMLKNVVDTVKPISETIKALNQITQEMGALKIGGPIATIKFKFAVRAMVDNIQYISFKLGNIWVDPKAAKSIIVLKGIVKSLADMTADMKTIAGIGPIVLLIRPIINKIINMMIQLSIKLSTIGTIGVAGSVGAAIMGQMLGVMAKGLLVFVLATMGGLVPLVAILSLLALKSFVWIFLKLFGQTTQIKIMIADVTIASMAKTILLLSLTVLMWALMGQLIIESWKEILITIGFVFLAILVFTFLGEMLVLIKVGQASIKQISMTLLMLSLTILLWSLMGDLIIEEWDSILVTILFVIAAIGVFTLLGWSMKFLKSGEQSILKLSLALILLSLTVLLWALMGELVMEEWLHILIVGVFVAVAIGLMWLLGTAGASIDSGSTSILKLALALGVLTLNVFLMASAGKVLMDNWLAILLVGIFISIIIGICVALTLAAAFIEPGAAILQTIAIALTIVSASFLVFALAMKLFDKKTINNTLNLFLALAVGLTAIGVMIAFVTLGAAALIIIGAALIIFSPAILIFSLAIAALKGVNAKYEDVVRPIWAAKWIVSAINDAFGLWGMIAVFSAIEKIMCLVPIAVAIGIIGHIISDIAAMRIPTEFDKDGKATAYQKMTTNDFIEAAANATAMTSILANLFGEKPFLVTVGGKAIMIKPITKEALEGITFSTMIKINMLMVIVKAIGRMAAILANVASLIVPDEEKGFDKEGKPLGWRKMTTKDFTEASENVALITMTLVYGLTQYKAKFLGGKSVSEAIEELSLKAIVKMSVLFDVLGKFQNLVTVVQMMAQMTVPTKWDKDGKPIAFKVLTPEERQAAIENTVIMMTEFLTAISNEELSNALGEMKGKAVKNFTEIMDATAGVKNLIEAIQKATELDEEKTVMGISNMKAAIERYVGMLYELFVETWEFQYTPKSIFGITIPWWSWVKVKDAIINVKQMEQAVEKMSMLTKTMVPLKNLMDSIKELAEADNLKTTQSGINSLKEVVKAYTEIFTGNEKGEGGVNITPTGEKKFQRFKEILEYQDKFAKINAKDLTANTDNFIRFIDKANSIDSDKIKSIRDMFEQMAEFSKSVKGDFDKLADILSEKLVVILEKLHGTLEGMNTEGVKGAARTESTITEGSAPKTPEQKAKEDKQNQQEKNLKDIKNALEEITSALRDIKDNTENFSRY